MLEATAVVSFDDQAGTATLAFRDAHGAVIDGSADDLARGFVRGGKRWRLSAANVALLERVAEHGGRFEAGRGFVLREEDVPDAMRALGVPSEIVVDARPLSLAEHVELVGDEQLVRETAFRDADGGASVPVERVQQQRGRSWVREGSRFHRRPALTAAEIDAIGGPYTQLYSGDDVPYFLAKQLAAAQRAGRRVIVGPRAAHAQVLEGDWLPDVTVDVAAERLRMNVGFRTGAHRVPWEAAVAAGERAYIPLAKDTWARNDRATRQRVDAALDAIPELSRDPATGTYDAPAKALPVLQETFASFGTLTLSESARALRDQLLDFRRIAHVAPPRGLKATFRAYQQHGYNWLCFLRTYGLAGILADDMGLGKTVQTLAAILAAHEAGQDGASLVVCPASVLSVWEREIAKWCDGVRGVVLSSANQDAYLREFPPRTIAIASYQRVARHAEAFGERVWSYLVLDEAHRVKNDATASARACKALLARHKLAVTGTPIQNRLRDLWALFDSIMPGHLHDTADEFERAFGGPIEKDGDEAAAERLRRRIDPFKLRRLKSEVAADLPPLVQELRSVKMLAPQAKLYRALVEELVPPSLEALRDPARRGSPLVVLEQLLRLRQVCAHPRLVDKALPLLGSSAKFDEFAELLDDCLEAGHKVLVFTQWQQMAALIREHLDARAIRHARIDGSVAAEDRGAIVSAFQRADGPPVLVVGLLAGGEGITLTEADTVILYDRWWNPAIEDQAIARAHRIGQARPVTAYILETRGTIEERLAKILGFKKHLGEELVHVDAAEKRIDRDALLAVLVDELEAAQR